MEPGLGELDTGGHPGRLADLVLSKNKITRNIPQDNLREMLPGDWQLSVSEFISLTCVGWLTHSRAHQKRVTAPSG